MSADNRQLFSVLVMKFLIYATVKLTHQSHYVSQIPVNIVRKRLFPFTKLFTCNVHL